ncbi:ABC transporter permease [Halosimplex pelagicum]|uniref:ABC transporter permease n=1 Tax=Halosimplex pelagicum TaxID=869886 RepID=A0A7D5TTS8_9EURY|nr:ABC transporter permease [Halosimplex pelagicum]QLH81734.1 ABC transporter permease [Halosimplex pelagicum]
MSTATGGGRLEPLVERLNVVVSAAGLVAVWLVLSRASLIGQVPSPVTVAVAMAGLVTNPIIHDSVVTSLLHILGSFLVAAAVAIPLGLAIGWSTVVYDLLFPSLEILRPVPPIAWIPLTILVLPSMRTSIMFITFVGAFFPILLNTIRGVQAVEEDYVRAVRSLGGSRAQVFRHVVYPAALPSIHTGLIVGMGLAWVNLVAAEMVADEGIGRFVWVAYTSGSYDDIVGSVIIIGAFGYASSELVRRLGNTQLRWATTDGE